MKLLGSAGRAPTYHLFGALAGQVSQSDFSARGLLGGMEEDSGRRVLSRGKTNFQNVLDDPAACGGNRPAR